MKTSMIVKLNFLLLGLGLSLYLIYSLNTKGLNPGVRALFGLAQTQNETRDDGFRWSWCDTRVTSIIRPEAFKISQEGSNWVRDNGESSVIDFVAFEKWLAKSCAVRAARVNKATEDESFLPALLVKFVDGQVAVIRRHPSGVFTWKGQAFTSPAFDAALDELSTLPEGRRK